MRTFAFEGGCRTSTSEIGRLSVSGCRERVDGALWLAMRDPVWEERSLSLSRDRGLRGLGIGIGPGEKAGVVGVGDGRAGTQRCRSRRGASAVFMEDRFSNALAAQEREQMLALGRWTDGMFALT